MKDLRTKIIYTSIGAILAPILAIQSAHSAEITDMTLNITGGSLTISAPATLNLGNASSPSVLTVEMAAVTVTDNRGILASNGWVVSVIASALTPAAGPTIAASAIGYQAGVFIETGTVTSTASNSSDLTGQNVVVTATLATDSHAVTWTPKVIVQIPSGLAAGTYTGTITHSVV